jgi:hypothetical protein
MTRSPTAQLSTPLPSAAISPAPSATGRRENAGKGLRPVATAMSRVWKRLAYGFFPESRSVGMNSQSPNFVPAQPDAQGRDPVLRSNLTYSQLFDL